MKDFLIKTITEAGKIAQEYFEGELAVTQKTVDGENMYSDVVTQADTAVNAFLVDTIRETYPDHAITSEEAPFIKGNSEYEWIIDPIDGTWDFAHSVPTWGIIIALMKHGQSLYSAVYFPVSKQLFFADEEKSYLNGVELKLDSEKRLSNARNRIFTMKPHGPYGVNFDRFHAAIQTYYASREHMPKQFGGASSQVYLTTKLFEFSIGNAGMDWDFVAPVHIIRNAGGIVTDSYGKEWERGMQEFVSATNKELHKEVLALFE